METKEIGRRGVLRMLLGLGAVAAGAGILMMPGTAEAATPATAEPEPIDVATDMAPESELPETELTQYYYRRRRPVYVRRRVVYVRPRPRVVYVRPRRRVVVVRRRRYW